MARYYRRRSYTRVVRPKKKWASGYKTIAGAIQTGTGSSFVYNTNLVENSTDSSNPTPVIIKTGNFRVQFDAVLNVGGSGILTARAYVVYIPEGWNLGTTGAEIYLNIDNIVAQHPEWIMVWRQLDFGNANASGSVDTTVVRMSSRLKRNLNSGDKIVFAILGTGDFTGITFRGQVVGGAQFWNCAN